MRATHRSVLIALVIAPALSATTLDAPTGAWAQMSFHRILESA